MTPRPSPWPTAFAACVWHRLGAAAALSACVWLLVLLALR